jgi:hypothetical protein
MKTRLLTILVILAFATIACKAAAPAADSTSVPSNVLFQDEFSNSKSGWDQNTTDEGVTDYADGVYKILVNVANTDIWANPGLDFSDTRIEVDATKIAGDDNNDFGVICRYKDTNNFYEFILSSDGYYGIAKVINGDQTLIGSDKMPPSDKIKTGSDTNHLRADCVGSTLTIYVNGEKLAEVTDTDLTGGDVGLFAGSFDTPGTEIHFDNFSVLKP